VNAAVLTGPRAFRVETVRDPIVGPGEALVRVEAAGICGTDYRIWTGERPVSYPLIPGHEWAGEIVAAGSAVTGFREHDRVVGECVIGADHFGFSISGAAAEYFVARPEWLHRLPDSMSWTQGALVEPFSCGYYATRRAGDLDASDTVAVLGAGAAFTNVVVELRAATHTFLWTEPTIPHS